jgi:vacuolar-type H+-ATPase subunit E/Vma4
MSIEHITAQIKRDAETEAQRIVDEAQQKKESIEQNTKELISSMQSDAQNQLEKAKEHRTAVRHSLAKQTRHMAEQAARRNALDGVMDDAYQQLVQLDADAYAHLVREYIQLQVADPTQITNVCAPANRTEETERVLSSTNITAPVEWRDNMDAGVVLQGSDFVINLTFASLFQNIRPLLEHAAAAKLFSDTNNTGR